MRLTNSSRAERRIGIFGHVGNQNLGDEAIFDAVIQNIKCRCPKAQIYGFTLNPEDTEKRHSITAFPIRRLIHLRHEGKTLSVNTTVPNTLNLEETFKSKLKTFRLLYVWFRGMKHCRDILVGCIQELGFLVQCYRNLKGIDLLVIAGSQQLIDYVDGPWAFPYTLFKWVVLAKAQKTIVAFVSVGAGPIQSRLGKFFAKAALVLSDYRSFRDSGSELFARNLRVRQQTAIVPDLVFSLKISNSSNACISRGHRPIVGINPVPFLDEKYWLGANASQYKLYIEKLAAFALWAIQRRYRILFFPTQLQLDPPVITDIVRAMREMSKTELTPNIVDKPILSFDDLVEAIRLTDIVVATRFHGIVIPYLIGKPVLGIAYQSKTIELMSQMGQSDYVVDIRSFETDMLETRFISLQSNSVTINREIKRRTSALRESLRSQYDQVLGLVA